MDWLIFIGVVAGLCLLVALVAREVAGRIAAIEGEPQMLPILIAILASAAVLQGAAKLAVLMLWIYERLGIAPETALDGQLRMIAFAASFLPIAAYVLVFLFTYRARKRGEGDGR